MNKIDLETSLRIRAGAGPGLDLRARLDESCRRSSLRKSLCQIVTTLIPYALLWAAMIVTRRQGVSYWLTLALATAAGAVLVRVFILFHDCCHGSFFASRRANTIFGYLTGILTFTPFEDWRHSHHRHHATAGNLDRRGIGDIWTMTTEEYIAAPRSRRLAYRIYRQPLVLLGPGAALLFLVLQRFSKKSGGTGARRSVRITNLALLGILILGSATLGPQVYLSMQLPVILVAGSAGLWLFYIQHQFEAVHWAREDAWDPMTTALRGSSYFRLPGLLQWLTGNIGLHHIHHAQPRIPNYHLQQCFDDIAALRAVPTLTLTDSFRALALSLYDEHRKTLVTFRAAARRCAAERETIPAPRSRKVPGGVDIGSRHR